MEKIHIRNIFRVFVPLNQRVGSVLAKTEPFGVECTQNDSQFEVNIRLVATDSYGNIKHEPSNCFTWAKRSVEVFQQNGNADVNDGLFLRLKINQGVFDFRKTKERLFRIIVELSENGSVTKTGASTIWELHPKKRYAENEESENECKFYYNFCNICYCRM
jgi:transcriptional/translational regulatory protein YebC/TACO1